MVHEGHLLFAEKRSRYVWVHRKSLELVGSRLEKWTPSAILTFIRCFLSAKWRNEETICGELTSCIPGDQYHMACVYKAKKPETHDFRLFSSPVGLEPTTTRLTAECSAIELLRNMDSGSDLLFRAVSQPSTIGTGELNFCVRDGNRCDLLRHYHRKL